MRYGTLRLTIVEAQRGHGSCRAYLFCYHRLHGVSITVCLRTGILGLRNGMQISRRRSPIGFWVGISPRKLSFWILGVVAFYCAFRSPYGLLPIIPPKTQAEIAETERKAMAGDAGAENDLGGWYQAAGAISPRSTCWLPNARILSSESISCAR